MSRDIWRSDEKPENAVYFQMCLSCGWEDQESYDDRDSAEVRECCPECESDDLDIGKDYV